MNELSLMRSTFSSHKNLQSILWSFCGRLNLTWILE